MKGMKEISFKIVKEGWNSYKISDGATIRIRPIAVKVYLSRAKSKKDGTRTGHVGIQHVITVSAPDSMTGPENPNQPSPEVAEKMEREPRSFEEEKEMWNEYDLEGNLYLKIKTLIENVERVIGEFSRDGMPYYLIRHTTVFAITSKEAKSKKKKSKGKVKGR